jgi:acyl-coenzyme A synthetase/AMP-(fatty) acid ligase
LGAIANKVNPDFRARELDYMLQFSGSSAYVFPKEWKDFDYAGMARGLAQGIPDLKRLIVLGGAVKDMYDFDAGVAAAPPIATAGRVHMDPNEVYRMCFTSGTTGNPKCALHSFNTTLYAVDLLNTDMQVTEREVMLVFLPLGLNWGYITLLQSILAGGTLVLMERFNPRAALELIQNERVTYIPTAPAGLVALLNAPDSESFDVSSLRVVITGGASAAVETIREYQTDEGPSHRALRHARSRLPDVYALYRRSAEGQRHHRAPGARHGATHRRRTGKRPAAGRDRRADVARPFDPSRLSQQSGRQRRGLQR